jgi:hypothetical protein
MRITAALGRLSNRGMSLRPAWSYYIMRPCLKTPAQNKTNIVDGSKIHLTKYNLILN